MRNRFDVYDLYRKHNLHMSNELSSFLYRGLKQHCKSMPYILIYKNLWLGFAYQYELGFGLEEIEALLCRFKKLMVFS